jgi:hypothetical protein
MGKDEFRTLNVEQNTTVGRLFGPSPFQVKLVVTVGLFGADITKRIPDCIHKAIFHIEEIFGLSVFTAYDDVPVIQVLPIKKFNLLFCAAGENHKGKYKEEG